MLPILSKFTHWRILSALGAIGLLVGLGWQVRHWRAEAARVEALEAQVLQARQEAEDVRSEKRAGTIRRYRLEIGSGADLGPAPVVRLCQPSITIAGDPTTGADGASPEAGELRDLRAGDTGPVDVGPELIGLLRAADRVSAQLRAVLELSGEPLF